MFPINLIQTRLVVQPFDNKRYFGFTDAVYKIVSAQGLKGLWRGVSFTLSGMCASVLLYDVVLYLLQCWYR